MRKGHDSLRTRLRMRCRDYTMRTAILGCDARMRCNIALACRIATSHPRIATSHPRIATSDPRFAHRVTYNLRLYGRDSRMRCRDYTMRTAILGCYARMRCNIALACRIATSHPRIATSHPRIATSDPRFAHCVTYNLRLNGGHYRPS